MSLMESLEPRMLLSGVGDTRALPENLGVLSGAKTVSDTLLKAQPVHFYKLTITSAGNLNAVLTSSSGNNDLQLLNSQGRPLSTSTRSGKLTDHVGQQLGSGVYYIEVLQGTASASSSYSLRLQADNNWGTITLGGQHRRVGLVFLDNAPRQINPNKETWIVIHGWQGSPQDSGIERLGQVLQAGHPERQVLALDWSSSAADPNIINAAGWIPAVAQFAANKLAQWGISSAHVNLAGHSFGGWVAGDLAGDASGGVNRIIAIDPATDDVFGLPLSGVDYAANSQASVAFIGSTFSTTSAAATAQESFRMKVGPVDSVFTHGNVLDMTASLIASESSNAISRLLKLDKITGSAGPWKLDQYKGGVDSAETDPTFEGIITGQQSGDHWQPATMVYKDATTGKTVIVSK